MYEPYPGGARMPEVQRPPAPAPVRTAVKIMYAGAVVSLVAIAVDVATIGATRNALAGRLRSAGATQVTVPTAPLVIGWVAGGLIAATLWVLIARACAGGRSWARITGTVLFALATVETLASLVVPSAAATKAVWPVMWLIGLAAVVFLWRRESTIFFRAPRQ